MTASARVSLMDMASFAISILWQSHIEVRPEEGRRISPYASRTSQDDDLFRMRSGVRAAIHQIGNEWPSSSAAGPLRGAAPASSGWQYGDGWDSNQEPRKRSLA